MPWVRTDLSGHLPPSAVNRDTCRVRIEDDRRYLTAANDRDWTVVADHGAHQVKVNGKLVDRATYIGDLRRLAEAHPDRRWEIADLWRDGERLAVRLTTTRTAGQGFELAQYYWADGRIEEVWTVGIGSAVAGP